MAADSVSEVTSQSWMGRIGGAFKGILFGFILFAIAFPVLFWNEGRAVKRAKALAEGAAAVVSIDSSKKSPETDGKLVHLGGLAESQETLQDTTFGISTPAIKLKRSVEMYQWDESRSSKTEKKLGGGSETKTTYSYEKKWSERPIDSSDFKEPAGHTNPGGLPYKSIEVSAKQVTLGAYRLSSGLISRINSYETLPIGSLDELRIQDPRAQLRENTVYIGDNPSAPKVGDVRINFSLVPNTRVSIVARQLKDTFEPYATSNGGEIILLSSGDVSAERMFKKAEEANNMMTWGLRALGLILMFIGLSAMLKPLSVLADVVPLFGDIVGAGTGLIAFVFALMFTSGTIAIAWLFYRPLIGIGLIVVVLGSIAFIVSKLKKQRAQRA